MMKFRFVREDFRTFAQCAPTDDLATHIAKSANEILDELDQTGNAHDIEDWLILRNASLKIMALAYLTETQSHEPNRDADLGLTLLLENVGHEVRQVSRRIEQKEDEIENAK